MNPKRLVLTTDFIGYLTYDGGNREDGCNGPGWYFESSRTHGTKRGRYWPAWALPDLLPAGVAEGQDYRWRVVVEAEPVED